LYFKQLYSTVSSQPCVTWATVQVAWTEATVVPILKLGRISSHLVTDLSTSPVA
jgi:hypothetical protein